MNDPVRRIAAAVTGIGIALCVLGWYQIAGQPTVPQQLPYLASATIPGAALLVAGLVLLLRAPLPGTAPRPRTDAADGARRAQTPPDGPQHATERPDAGGGRAEGVGGGRAEGLGSGSAEGPRGGHDGGLWQVPDGRYLHSADCPLLDGRTDAIPASLPPTETTETTAPEPEPAAQPTSAASPTPATQPSSATQPTSAVSPTSATQPSSATQPAAATPPPSSAAAFPPPTDLRPCPLCRAGAAADRA